MITAPTGLDLKRENIPRELKGLDQWVGWRWKQFGQKRTKVPYDLKTGKAAASDDPTTWAPYSKTEGHLNIGFMFGDDDAFCGIDVCARSTRIARNRGSQGVHNPCRCRVRQEVRKSSQPRTPRDIIARRR